MARDESQASGAVVPAKSSFRGLFVGQGVARLPSRPGTLESSAASSQQTSLSLPTLLRASWVRWSCACSFEWLSVGRPEMDTRRSLQASCTDAAPSVGGKGFREKHANLFSVMKAFVDCSFATKCGKWKILDSRQKLISSFGTQVKKRPLS